MDAWVVWIVVACVLAVGEIAAPSFFLAPFAVGALAAALADGLGAGLAGSLAVFVAASAALLVFARPIARRHLYSPPQLRTGTAALIGRPAQVLERIDNAEGVGCAKIEGEVWTARAFHDDRVIEPGERVEVMEIRGATALLD
jgi:membrane protein implicated in regulation of membrane protease activity